MEDVKVYRVYDTKTSSYWSSQKGKTVWLRPGSAKNSWNIGSGIHFNHEAQSRYIIHSFSLVRDLEEVV